MRKDAIDLTGMRFGRLVVIENAERKNGKTYWRCRCDCGQTSTVQSGNLRRGKAKSCGCSMLGNTLRLTHGQTHTRLHHIWHGIKQRCLNPKSYIYKNYGGRGITVCDEWRDSFEVFYGWAMANGYADDLTIDRIDVNGNYEPLNCRWATPKEQGNNRRTNHLLTYKGQTRTTQEWADIKGLSRECIRWRLANGWSVEEALEKPARHKKE